MPHLCFYKLYSRSFFISSISEKEAKEWEREVEEINIIDAERDTMLRSVLTTDHDQKKKKKKLNAKKTKAKVDKMEEYFHDGDKKELEKKT